MNNNSKIKVIVHGAMGKMGLIATEAILQDDDLSIVGFVGSIDRGNSVKVNQLNDLVPYTTDLDFALNNYKPDVVIDLTNAKTCMFAARLCAEKSVPIVTGSSGLSDSDLVELESFSKSGDIGILVVPNFALGAVILSYIATIAAQFFNYVEIIESHHDQKIDAPSGTAISLAKSISNNKQFFQPSTHKETIKGTRGGNYNTVNIHSIRLPGKLAHHEVIFGSNGQTLSLRHDTLSRDCYIPTISLSLKKVIQMKSLVVGLEAVLELT
jgi:4-hydroxy-tetrahydrodipicolinate reductase